MKFKLKAYYFVFAVITFGLFALENNTLGMNSNESGNGVELIERRPVEPNAHPEEKDKSEVRKSRPKVSYRSNQIC